MEKNKKSKIKRILHKKYDFSNYEHENIPKNVYNTRKWSIDILQKHKYELNQIKSLLNNYNLEEWSQHTKKRDISTYVMRFIKNKFKPELLTQAWCKFYECLSIYPLIPEEAIICGEFNSVHLCEAPGAFISSLNHYLATNLSKLSWRWYATTLNPNHESNCQSQMIIDDRLLRYTYENWLFGPDFTGDITKYYNHMDLVKTINQIGNVWLVTADGSMDCMSDPGNQERIVEYLHYCETITALSILRKGGSFFLKIFTIFEDSTVCLLYLLNIVFKQVSIFKPVCSKGGNSEVYVICIDYKGKDCLEDIWEKLCQPYREGSFDSNYSMFDLNEINKNYISEINNCVEYFKLKQINVIQKNILHFRNMSDEESSKIHQMQISIANKFISNYNLKLIPKNRRLVTNLEINPTLWQNIQQLTFNNNLLVLDNEYLIPCQFELIHLELKMGKAVDEVKSSRFCKPEVLNHFKFPRNKSPCNFYRYIIKGFDTNLTILDLHTNFYNYSNLRQYVFDKFLQSNKNFLIIGIPFITNFLAGLLFLLISCYDKIYLHRSGFILLVNPIDEKFRRFQEMLQIIKKDYQSYENYECFLCDLCQIIPPHFLHNNNYSNFLYNYNNLVLTKHWRML